MLSHRDGKLVDMDCVRRIIYRKQPRPSPGLRTAWTMNLMPHHFTSPGAMSFKELREGPRRMLAQKMNEAALLVGNKPWDEILQGVNKAEGEFTIEMLPNAEGKCVGYRLRALTRMAYSQDTMRKMHTKSLDTEARAEHQKAEAQAKREEAAAKKQAALDKKAADRLKADKQRARLRREKEREKAKAAAARAPRRRGRAVPPPPSEMLEELFAADSFLSDGEGGEGGEGEERAAPKRTAQPLRGEGPPRKKRRLVMEEDADLPSLAESDDEGKGEEEEEEAEEEEGEDPDEDDEMEEEEEEEEEEASNIDLEALASEASFDARGEPTAFGDILADAFKMHQYECNLVKHRHGRRTKATLAKMYGKGPHLDSPLYSFLSVDKPEKLFNTVIFPYYAEHDDPVEGDTRAFAELNSGFSRTNGSFVALTANTFTAADGFVYNLDGYGVQDAYLTPASYYKDAYGPYPMVAPVPAADEDAMDLDEAAAAAPTTASARFAFLATEAPELAAPGAPSAQCYPKGATVVYVMTPYVLAEMLLERPLPVPLGVPVGPTFVETYTTPDIYAARHPERVARAIECVRSSDAVRSPEEMLAEQALRLRQYSCLGEEHPLSDLREMAQGFEDAREADVQRGEDALVAQTVVQHAQLVQYVQYRDKVAAIELRTRRILYSDGKYPGHLCPMPTESEIAGIQDATNFFLQQMARARNPGAEPVAEPEPGTLRHSAYQIAGMMPLSDEATAAPQTDDEARYARALDMRHLAGDWSSIEPEIIKRSAELQLRVTNKARWHLLFEKMRGRPEEEIAQAVRALTEELGLEALNTFLTSQNEMPDYLRQKQHAKRLLFGSITGERREVPLIPPGPVINDSDLQTCVTSLTNVLSSVAQVNPINEKQTLRQFILGLAVYQTPEKIGDDLKPNIINAGEAGTGKSFAMMAAGMLYLDGAMINFSHMTTHSVNTDANWYKTIHYSHEAQSSWLVNKDDKGAHQGSNSNSDSTGVNFLKSILTEKKLTSHVLVTDKDTGKRETVVLRSYFQCSLWLCINWDIGLISKPMLTRWIVTEQPRPSENMTNTHPVGAIKLPSADTGRVVYEHLRQKHLVMALLVLTEAMFTCNVFPTSFNNDMTYILNEQLAHVLRSEAKMASSTFHKRNIDHIPSSCRGLSIYKTCFQLLAMPEGHEWLAANKCSAASFQAISGFILPRCFVDKEVYIYVVDMLLSTEDAADTLTALSHHLSAHSPKDQFGLVVPRAEEMQGDPAVKAALGLVTFTPPEAAGAPAPNGYQAIMGTRPSAINAALSLKEDHRYIVVRAPISSVGDKVSRIMAEYLGYSVRAETVVAFIRNLEKQTIASPYYEKHEENGAVSFHAMALPDGTVPTHNVFCAVVRIMPGAQERGRAPEQQSMQVGISRFFIRTRMGLPMAAGDEAELANEMLPVGVSDEERARFTKRLAMKPLERLRTAEYDAREFAVSDELATMLSYANKYENPVVHALSKILQTDTLGMRRRWEYGCSLTSSDESSRVFVFMLFSRMRDVYATIRLPNGKTDRRLLVLSRFNKLLRLMPTHTNNVITFENMQRGGLTMQLQLDAALVELDESERARARDIHQTSAITIDTDVDTHSHAQHALQLYYEESAYFADLKACAGIEETTLWTHPDAIVAIRKYIAGRRHAARGRQQLINFIAYPRADIVNEAAVATALAREYHTGVYHHRRSMQDMMFTPSQRASFGLAVAPPRVVSVAAPASSSSSSSQPHRPSQTARILHPVTVADGGGGF